jgi:hypothetical protein
MPFFVNHSFRNFIGRLGPRGIALFSAAMVCCAVVGDSLMDGLSYRYDQSIFKRFESHQIWLDPRLSWKNKWKNGRPSDGEAFPLSSTVLAPLTDGWHFLKFLTILFLDLALTAPFAMIFRLRFLFWLGLVGLVYLLYGLVFETLFSFLLTKNGTDTLASTFKTFISVIS